MFNCKSWTIAFGQSLPDAFELAQEVDNLAKQYIKALVLGRPKLLSLNEMKKVLSKSKTYKRGQYDYKSWRTYYT